jgi:hypothetical protein
MPKIPKITAQEVLVDLKAAITKEQRANRIDANLLQWLRDYGACIFSELGATSPGKRKVKFLAEGAILLELGSESFAEQIKAFLMACGCAVEMYGAVGTTIKLIAIPDIQLNQIVKKVYAKDVNASSPVSLSVSPKSPGWLESLKQKLTKSSPDSAIKVVENALKDLCQPSASLKIHAHKKRAGEFLIDCKQEDIANAIHTKLKELGCAARVKTDAPYANRGVIITAIPGIDLQKIFKVARTESQAATPISTCVNQMSETSPRTSWSASTASGGAKFFSALSVTPPTSPIPQTTPTRQSASEHRVDANSALGQRIIIGGMLAKATNIKDALQAIKDYIKDNKLDQEVDKEFNILGFKFNGKSKSDGISKILKIIDSLYSLEDKFKNVSKLLMDKVSEQGYSWQEKHSAPASRENGFAGFFKPTRARPIAEFYSIAADAIEDWSKENLPKQAPQPVLQSF